MSLNTDREMYVYSTEPVNFISYKEVEKILADYMGVDKYEYLISDLYGAGNSEWANDTTHVFNIEEPDKWIQPYHQQYLTTVQNDKKVRWNWELVAVLEYVASMGMLPFGTMCINVCW